MIKEVNQKCENLNGALGISMKLCEHNLSD
jgi:hypothetical protein